MPVCCSSVYHPNKTKLAQMSAHTGPIQSPEETAHLGVFRDPCLYECACRGRPACSSLSLSAHVSSAPDAEGAVGASGDQGQRGQMAGTLVTGSGP